MRKIPVLPALFLIAVLAVLLFAGDYAGSSRLADASPFRCTTVIAGKNATIDGSVLLGHNEDWGAYLKPLFWNPREKHAPGDTFRLKDGQSIPQIKETYAFIWPAAECNGINEHQVALADDTGSCRKELFQNERGIDLQEFVTLALERSRSAREAVLLMGGLIEKYGYRSHNGRDGDIISIADPSEGWWMEITIGGLWVAQRVPDDAFVVLANRFRIGEVDLSDTSRFLASPKLVDFAKQKSWYDPAQGRFNFSRAYGTPESIRSVYSSRREWRGNSLLAGKAFDEKENPLIVKASRKLGPRDLMALFRDHYEGTEYDLTKGYEKGSPHRTAERTICRLATDATTVAQLRGWLPPEIGGVIWLSAGTPCSSVYLPFYLGVVEFPKPFAFLTEVYSRDNAYWVFNSLQNLVDRYYNEKAEFGKSGMTAINYVAGYWKDFEDEEFALQDAVEKAALDLFKRDKAAARSFLSAYCNGLGLKAFHQAQALADTLRTKYYR
ncbi:MAG: C69 family dipeptidase [Candidatus Aminicenantales bacterium]